MDYLATMTTHVPGGEVNEAADGFLRLTWRDVEREAAALAGRNGDQRDARADAIGRKGAG